MRSGPSFQLTSTGSDDERSLPVMALLVLSPLPVGIVEAISQIILVLFCHHSACQQQILITIRNKLTTSFQNISYHNTQCSLNIPHVSDGIHIARSICEQINMCDWCKRFSPFSNQMRSLNLVVASSALLVLALFLSVSESTVSAASNAHDGVDQDLAGMGIGEDDDASEDVLGGEEIYSAGQAAGGTVKILTMEVRMGNNNGVCYYIRVFYNCTGRANGYPFKRCFENPFDQCKFTHIAKLFILKPHIQQALEETANFPIHVQVQAPIMRLLVEWARNRPAEEEGKNANKGVNEVENDEAFHRLQLPDSNDISDYDRDFFASMDESTVFAVTIAANYLQMTDLQEAGCKTIANMIKSVGGDRETFKLKFGIDDMNDHFAINFETVMERHPWIAAELKAQEQESDEEQVSDDDQ